MWWEMTAFDQRDRLIDALNKPGPGTLVHPTYGELKVCVDGEVRVSTSKSEGRIVRFDLKFVEAGELSYPHIRCGDGADADVILFCTG